MKKKLLESQKSNVKSRKENHSALESIIYQPSLFL